MIPNRVLIKLSGEAISGEKSVFDFDVASALCENIKHVTDSGILVSVVIGGGNIIRGRDISCHELISRETADSVGMMATVMNGILFKEILNKLGIESELVSNLRLPFNIKPSDFDTISKMSHKVLIFVGGIGYPYFSTDTVSAIAAYLSKCDLLLKATKTDGVYDRDPNKFEDAKFIDKLTYEEALAKNIEVMDRTAFSLMMLNRRIPTYIFSIKENNCFINAINKKIKLSIVE